MKYYMYFHIKWDTLHDFADFIPYCIPTLYMTIAVFLANEDCLNKLCSYCNFSAMQCVHKVTHK